MATEYTFKIKSKKKQEFYDLNFMRFNINGKHNIKSYSFKKIAIITLKSKRNFST